MNRKFYISMGCILGILTFLVFMKPNQRYSSVELKEENDKFLYNNIESKENNIDLYTSRIQLEKTDLNILGQLNEVEYTTNDFINMSRLISNNKKTKASVVKKSIEEELEKDKKENTEDEIFLFSINETNLSLMVPEVSLSNKETTILYKIVQAEAGGESQEGKRAVASVVLNRVISDKFPNSINEVVFQKNQFTPTSKKGFVNTKPSEETIMAVNEVIKGYRSFDTSVLYFCNPNTATNKWMINNREFVVAIENHSFYR